MTESKSYEGRCQCGAVRYRVETSLEHLMDCNCSRCKRLGSVMTFVPATSFALLAGEGAQTEYRFNTDRIAHLFCTTCGIESFARGTDAKGNATIMVNVNCLDGVPPVDRSTITHWDGASR